VAYLLIDAVIDVSRMRERLSEAPDDFFIKPSAIADELWHLYNQDRSAWSFLAELRPFGEKMVIDSTRKRSCVAMGLMNNGNRIRQERS
jgi:hypothetical protein